MKASKNKQTEAAIQNGSDTKVKHNGNAPSGSKDNDDIHHLNKKLKIQEKITYEDLDANNEIQDTGNAQLNLSKVITIYFFKFVYLIFL